MIRNRRVLLWLVFVLGAGACARRPGPAFIHLAEARRLAAQIETDLSKASDASDRAVLADTDEQSAMFARQAQGATRALAARLPELAGHLAALSPADAGLLAQFRERFERYQQLDAQILALAVENTNLKAQRLSFGPVRQAGDAFCAALDRATARGPAREAALGAELAIREIQVLQAPHIAEPRETEMDHLEREMSARAAAARSTLQALSGLVGSAGQPHLDEARAALDRFEALSRELVVLSRRNTNVRSLELALRRKPPLTAACDQSLAALQQALAQEGFTGTR